MPDAKLKTYFLTKEEKEHLIDSARVQKLLIYLTECVDLDMKVYFEGQVKRRCGLKPEDTPKVTLSEGKFTVEVKNQNEPAPDLPITVKPAEPVKHEESTGPTGPDQPGADQNKQ